MKWGSRKQSSKAPSTLAKRSILFRVVAALIAVVVCAGGVGLVMTSPSSAASESVFIRSVDTRQFPDVSLSAMRVGAESSTENIRVTENKTAINPNIRSFGDASVPTGIVLMIDASAAARDSDSLQRQKEAAIAMINAKAPGQQYAIVAYNTAGRVVANFTDDTASLAAVINGLSGNGQSALYDGIRTATAVLRDKPDLQPNVMVMNASREAISNSTGEEALHSLQDTNASLFAAVVSSAQENERDTLTNFAEQTHGRAYEVSSPSALTQVLGGVSSALSKQALISYTSKQKPGALNITVTAGSASETARVGSGTLNIGAAATPPEVKATNLGILGGPLGMLLLGIFALLAVGLLVFVIGEVITMDRNQLSRALRPYNTDAEEEKDLSRLADSDLIKKAVAETAKIAEKRGLLQNVEQRLEQAEVPLKPAEAIFFTAAIAVVAMIIGSVALGFLGFAAAGLVFAALPVMLLSFKAKRRRRKFTSQLPDTLQLLAGSLRAGYSLIQGLDAVAKQVEAPMGSELTRALAEARLGRPVEEALQEVSDRMASEDFEWAVMAIKIQREVGGNLAELLMTVSNTMIERERLRREVRALTAEGRMSAIILVGLPPAICLLITIMNPGYMQPLFSSLIGQVLLVAATISMGIGYFLMNKMIQIEA